MPPNDPNNPTAFDFEVTGEDNLKKAVNSSERAMLDFSKSVIKLAKHLEDESEKHRQSGEAATEAAGEFEESTRSSERSTKKRGRLSRMLVSFFRREKDAAGEAGLSVRQLGTLLGGATFVGAIFAAGRSFLEWNRQVLHLNTTLGDQPELISSARDRIRSLGIELGTSADEMLRVTTLMGDMNIVSRDLMGTRVFRDMRADIVALGKSMDVSTESVTDLWGQFTKVFKLPVHRLRGIAASMKFIQEKTAISGNELIAFTESLDELTSRLITSSADARADLTRDFGAIAGFLKEGGIDPKQFPSIFAEALKKESEQGQAFLAFLEENTGRSMESIQKMIRRGDVVTPMELFIESIQKVGPQGIEDMETFLNETTSLSSSTLFKMLKLNRTNLRKFIADNKKAEQANKLHLLRNQQRLQELQKQWERLKEVFRRIWYAIGKIVVEAAERLARFAVPMIENAINMLSRAFKWFVSPEGKEATREWMEKAWSTLKSLGSAFVSVIGFIKGLIEEFRSLPGWAKGVVGGLAGIGVAAGALLGKGPLGLMVTTLLAAKAAAEWLDARQSRGMEGQRVAKDTNRLINLAAGFRETKEGKFERSDNAGMQKAAIKAIIGGSDALFTLEGKINTKELEKRIVASSESAEDRAFNKREWTKWLTKVAKTPVFQGALESRKRDIASLSSIQAPAGASVPAQTVADSIPTAPMQPTTTAPNIVAVNSKSTDTILMGIKSGIDVLVRQSSRSPLTHSSHPSRSALAEQLSG